MSGISDSAKFNNNSSYYFPSDANTSAGVLSLNSVSGVVSVACPDNSIVVSPAAPLINISTNGQPQAPSTVASTGAITSGGVLTATGNLVQTAALVFPATGTAVAGNWKQTVQLVGGYRKYTWTLYNSAFGATTVLNIPIVGNVASKVKVFCVNNGNTQSRSIQAEYSISVASGVYTQGAAFETNFNMTPTWIGSGGAAPLQYTVQLSGGGGGLVGTISCIIEQYVVEN